MSGDAKERERDVTSCVCEREKEKNKNIICVCLSSNCDLPFICKKPMLTLIHSPLMHTITNIYTHNLMHVQSHNLVRAIGSGSCYVAPERIVSGDGDKVSPFPSSYFLLIPLLYILNFYITLSLSLSLSSLLTLSS